MDGVPQSLTKEEREKRAEENARISAENRKTAAEMVERDRREGRLGGNVVNDTATSIQRQLEQGKIRKLTDSGEAAVTPESLGQTTGGGQMAPQEKTNPEDIQ